MSRATPLWSPALRDGVAASRVAVAAGPWQVLGEFLQQRMPAVTDWPLRLAQGLVLNAQGQPLRFDSPCLPGEVVWYWRAPPPEPRVPFELTLLHQDEHLVVVDKPHFLSVAPTGRYLQETALVRLTRLLGITTLAPMHRLDRETAGVLVFTVQPATRAAYHALLRQRQVHKVYEAVAPWRADLALPCRYQSRLEQPSGRGFMQMQTVAGQPNAETQVELIRRLQPPSVLLSPWCHAEHPAEPGPTGSTGLLALYRLLPLTGRRHQLRAQMCALGLPILGDRIYPQLWPEPAPGAEPDYRAPLQLLARKMAFTDPMTGQLRLFTSVARLQLAGLG